MFTSGDAGAFAGSAVCVFANDKMDRVFAGKFAGNFENGEPVAEERVPVPRPGNCGQDTTQLSDSAVNFIR